MSAKNLLAVTLFSLLTLTGCGDKNTAGGISDDDPLVRVHADLFLLGKRGEILRLDSVTIRRGRDSILAAYHISENDYSSKLEARKRNLEEWRDFNAAVVHRLELLQQALGSRKDSVKSRPSK